MMKRIVTYKVFESGRELLTPEQIDWLNKCSGVTNKWTLNPDTGFVDVNQNFFCTAQNLTDFKGIRFGKVNGFFRCDHNQLTSLKGAPESVGGDFFCNNNQLSSLEGAPQSVGGFFRCDHNQLTSLKGAPKSVGGDFGCSNNQLISLEGAPKSVGGIFWPDDNTVSRQVLELIYSDMKQGISYPEAVKKNWDRIGLHDKALLYRPDFSWLGDDERKKVKALASYKRIEDLI